MKYVLTRIDRMAVLRIVAIYVLVAAPWIYFSDTALGVFVTDQALLVRISVFKGFIFIIITGALLSHLIARYIHASKRIEEELRASQDLVTAIVEGTTDAVYAKDRQGRYLLFNGAAVRFTGKTAPEAIGRDDTLLFPPAEAGIIMNGDRQVMDTGQVTTVEERLPAADGSYRTYLATKGPIYDALGQVSGLFGIARDITERKRAEDRTAYLATFPQLNPNPIIEVSSSGQISFLNPASERALEALGFSKEDGRVLLPPDIAEALRILEQKEERTIYREVNIRDRVFGEHIFIAPQLDAVRIYAFDITQRRQVEKAVQEQERRLNAIVANLPAVLYLKDLEGRYVLANPVLEQRLNLSHDKIIGKTDFDLFPPETAQALRENDLHVASTRKRFDVVEKVFIENDWRTYMSHKFPIPDEAGNVQFIGGVSFDISDARQAEERLAQNEALLRAIISSIPRGMVFVVDPELRYLVAEGRLASTLGLARESMEGRTLREIFDEDVAELLETQYRKALAGATASIEMEYRGFCLWANYAPLFDEGGKIVAALSLVQDITDLKKAEEAIRKLNQDLNEKNVKLEAAHSELESFIYSLSHDLSQAARDAAFFARYLNAYADRLDGRGRDYLSRLGLNTAKINQMIETLLTFFKVSRQEMARTVVDLSALASSVIKRLRESHPGRALETEIKEGVTALADSQLAELIIFHLISNAWKFTNGKDMARIEFGAFEREGKAVYYVKDNGIGIAPREAERIFRPFQQLHAGEAFKGTGLGLPIVERAVGRHGGRVWAEGEPGAGTTMFFTLS